MLLVAGNMFLEATCCRQQATCCRQQNCYQFVACLLLYTKGYMLPRYRQHVAGNKQHVAGQHVTGQHVAWCKRGFTLTGNVLVSISIVTVHRLCGPVNHLGMIGASV